MATDKNTPTEKAEHLPAIDPTDIEQRARQIVEAKLAEDRAKEMLKEARAEGENMLEKAAGGLSKFASKTSKSLSTWKEEREQARKEREKRERAQEIARERLIQQHMEEAERQLEQERLEEEAAKQHKEN